jgi:hypothetical protein
MKHNIPAYILFMFLVVMTTKYIKLRIAYQEEIDSKLKICKQYEELCNSVDTCVSRKF